MGIGCQWSQPGNNRVGTSHFIPGSPEKVERLEVESVANDQIVHQSCLCNKGPIQNPPKREVWRAFRLEARAPPGATIMGPKLQIRNSFVWDFTLCISSSGC